MHAYLIDAYDSFVYIIYQYVRTLGIEARVVRNDQVEADDIARSTPDFILLGPGPGHPSAAHYLPIIERFGGKIPILGVCLGHQAIGLAFGATVVAASHLMHGKTSLIEHDAKGCFTDLPSALRATRYHSLIVKDGTVPDCLEVTARANDDGYIMGLRHKSLPIESVQFHPESVYTDHGVRIVGNFVRTYVGELGRTHLAR